MVLSVRVPIRRLFSTIARVERQELSVFEARPELILEGIYTLKHIDMIELNSELRELVKTGHLTDARIMFDRMPHRDEISWTTIISGYVNAHCATEGLGLFSSMWVEPGLRMDPFVLSLALKACGLDLNANYGKLLHGYSVKSGLVNSVFVGSSLLDMLMKIGYIDEGCRIFDEMPLRNVVTWTAIITGLVRAGFNEMGLLYFSEMWRSKEVCDSYTFAIALKACADLGALNHGREIHTQALKKDIDQISFVVNTLATMYNKCGKLAYGMHLFEEMKNPDVVSWTTIITSHVQRAQEKQAVEAFIRMRRSDVSPNSFTFAALISGCANLARIKWGEQLHASAIHLGLANCLSVANSIIALYSKCGQLAPASMVFHGMTKRDIVSWSAIISGYSQGGYAQEAFEFLALMRREGPKPNEFAIASVLSVCGNMAILEQGKQLHAHVITIGLERSDMIRSSLINMYSKSGSVMEASKIFDVVETNDIVSWTAMINGYAEHGYSQEAIDLFEKIPATGLRPDYVTFIGVLTACNHAGLADLGFDYFNAMSKKYQINPSKEHYGCMIDLLCRAGRLSDAEHMIKSMPFEKDDVVWSILLRACRLHGDVDRGRRTAEQLLKLDPECAVTHITLANIYSAKGKWKEAAEVRKVMKLMGVMKEPGWSWIKVKDHGSAFVAGDRAHPLCEYVYSILDLLALRADLSSEMDSLIDVEY